MRVLLVIDDYEDIAPLFQRFLRKAFDEVHVSSTVAEAEAVLASRPVTHLVVDSHLGPGSAEGGALVSGWRTAWPQIRYAALFSGARPRDELPAGIDAAFTKPIGFDALIDALSSRD